MTDFTPTVREAAFGSWLATMLAGTAGTGYLRRWRALEVARELDELATGKTGNIGAVNRLSNPQGSEPRPASAAPADPSEAEKAAALRVLGGFGRGAEAEQLAVLKARAENAEAAFAKTKIELRKAQAAIRGAANVMLASADERYVGWWNTHQSTITQAREAGLKGEW